MKRGSRILLFLVLVIVILVAVAFLLLKPQCPGGLFCPPATATPAQAWISIVVVGQPINQYDEIKAESLTSMEIPPNLLSEKMITDPEEVTGKFAAFPLAQGLPLTKDMVTDRPDLMTKNPWSRKIQPGLVAIAIPITRLSSVAFAVRDGDYVNVIATTMFVDLDSAYQSILPNNIGQVVNVGAKPDEAPLVTLGMSTGGIGASRSGGRAELDPLLNQAIYLIPAEAQRPRIVSQTILQHVQVLHTGSFDEVPQQPQATPATDAGGQPVATPAPTLSPDVITLMVSPQDAVALTYLMYGGAKLTLALRAPDDDTRPEMEAATLQYLLSQYAIPVPAKLPYGIQPRMDGLIEPVLKNDIPTPHP
jgi:Flp pilus assembly protein CpaB